MEEVKREIKGGMVIGARRLQASKGGIRSANLSVLLTFEKTLPTEIKIGWLNYRLKE